MEHTRNLKSSIKLNNKNSSAIGNSNISKDKFPKSLKSKFSNQNNPENTALLSPPRTIATCRNEEVIFIADHTKMGSKKTKGKSATYKPKSDNTEKSLVKLKQNDVNEIDLVTEIETRTSDSQRKSDLVGKKSLEQSHSNVNENYHNGLNDDVIIVNEKPIKEQTKTVKKSKSTAFLRSEFIQEITDEVSPGNSIANEDHFTKLRQKCSDTILQSEVSKQKDEDVVIIKEEIKLTEKTSPRLLRSDLIKQKSPVSCSTNSEQLELPIKNEKKLLRSDMFQTVAEVLPQKDNLDKHSNKVIVSSPQENACNTLTEAEIPTIHNQYPEKSVGEEIISVKEELKPNENVSIRTLRSDAMQTIKVESYTRKSREQLAEEVLVISEDKVPTRNEKTSPRLLRSEIAQQKMKNKSPQKNKQIDLDEIMVLNEKQIKKPKERTISGRLLRSELALQKSREILPVKKEVEEVVVLIHDEPKPKQKLLACHEGPQKNKKINIQEEVIVLSEEIRSSKKSSPRSLRSDTGQKRSPEKTIAESLLSDDLGEETTVEKHISSSRLLRSEIVTQHNSHNLQMEESKSSVERKVEKQRILRSEITSKKSPQAMTNDHPENFDLAEKEQMRKQTPPSRSLRSVVLQHSSENLPTKETKCAIDKTVEKLKLPSSEITSKKIPRAMDQHGTSEVAKGKLEKPTSPSRLLRSVIASQHSPQNLSEDSQSPIETIEKRKTVKSEIINKKSVQAMSKDRSKSYEVTEEQIEKKTSPSRLLRSIASQHSPRSLPEESVNSVKIKIQNQRLPGSEITSPKSRDNIIDDSGTLDIGENRTIKSSRLRRSEIVSTENPENLPKEQTVVSQTIQNSKTEKQTFSPRLLRSEITTQKKTPNLQNDQIERTEVINGANVEKQTFSPRLLRSEMSSQNLLRQVSDSSMASVNTNVENVSRSDKSPPQLTKTELVGLEEIHAKKKEKTPLRKTKSLLMESKTKLKTPMLLRSELAQLKNLDTCPNQKQVCKKIENKKAGRSKSTPPPFNLEVPVEELSSNVQTNKGKAPKRKSLIDDMRRKKSPKQKAVAMQNAMSSPDTILKPTEVSQELPEVQKQINDQNINNDTSPKILDNNLPNSIDVRTDESENQLKRNNKTQDASKSNKPDIKIEENPTEHPLKYNSEVLDAPKNVKFKTKIEENPMENPLKRKGKAQDVPISIKPKVSKKIRTPTKLKSTLVDSPPEEVGAGEKSSTGQNRKRLSVNRKLKVTTAVESTLSLEELVPNEKVTEEVKVSNTPEKKAPKQIDTTVFDFDENEPEVVPLRLSSPRKDRSIKLAIGDTNELIPPKSNADITPKPKKQKLSGKKTNMDDPKTKAQAKAKLLAMLGDKSPQKNNLESPKKPKSKSTKTKSASTINTENDQPLDVSSTPKQAENTKKNKKSPVSNKTNNSPSKTIPSPMKQTTITDLFNKAFVKKEKANLAESVFGPVSKQAVPEEPLKENTNVNTITDMAPPKTEKKIITAKIEEEENDLYDDEDSDCESRIEWIPEEYAEYKFKYSAKKMMSYKPIHKCKICLLVLPSYYRLSQHKKEHTKKPNPYNCTQCDQAFPSIEDLTAHLRIHKGKHPYTCKKCDIGFWSKKSLDAHTPIHVLRKAKQRIKRFRCDVCAKEFIKLCDMERHMRVHTGEKPCVCNICNKRFQQSHNLSKHLLTHLHVKPYHCEICNKQFGRNDVLNRHLLTHSVDKPIKCPLCSKGFIRQTQLNNHMKKTHPDAAKINTKVEPTVVEAK